MVCPQPDCEHSRCVSVDGIAGHSSTQVGTPCARKKGSRLGRDIDVLTVAVLPHDGFEYSRHQVCRWRRRGRGRTVSCILRNDAWHNFQDREKEIGKCKRSPENEHFCTVADITICCAIIIVCRKTCRQAVLDGRDVLQRSGNDHKMYCGEGPNLFTFLRTSTVGPQFQIG